MASGQNIGDRDPFPEFGSGNFDEALEAAMGATQGGPGGADDFLMGGDLTLDQIRTLSTTSQRSAASAASLPTSGPDDTERHVTAVPTSMPQFGALEQTGARVQAIESPGRRKVPGIPSASPRPRPQAKTPVSKAPTPSSPQKKKSPLPRVAMLAQSTTPKRVQTKQESPAPFRAGGNANSTARRTPPAGRTPTASGSGTRRAGTLSPSRSSSSVMAREMSTKSSVRTTAGTGGPADTAGAKPTSPKSLQERPRWGVNPAASSRRKTPTPTSSAVGAASRRAIAKPPENIKRAIKESQVLTDSLDSKEDNDMQNLKEILNDIKTIKSELGVESATGKTEDGIDGANKDDGDGEVQSANMEQPPNGDPAGSDVGSTKTSPRKSPKKGPASSSPTKGNQNAMQETSMEDSIEILEKLDEIQDKDAAFLNDGKKVTDELDEVSGPSFAEVEKATAREEIEAQKTEEGVKPPRADPEERPKAACMPCCSVM